MFDALPSLLRPSLRSFGSILTAWLVSISFVGAQDFFWVAPSDGDWTVAANWDPDTDYPDEAGLSVRLLGAFEETGETATITLNQTVTIGELFVQANTNFSNFIVSGSGSLILDNGTEPAGVGFQQVQAGVAHDIKVPISVVSDTLNLSGRRGGISGNITAAPGNDLTINWTGGDFIMSLSGDNNFNNGTIVSTSAAGIRFQDSPTAAGGPSTTIQLNGGDVQFVNLVTGSTELDFGNSLEVSGTSALYIGGLNVNNAVFNSSITLGDITLAADSTLQYLRTAGGGRNNAPRVRIGEGRTLTLGDNATLILAGTQTHIVDITDQSLLQGTGTVRVEDDNENSRVRVLAGGTVRPGHESATGILNVGSDTVQGRLEMQEDSIMRFRLNGTAAGSDYDQVRFGLGPSVSPLTVDPDSVLLELELNYWYNPSDVVFLIRSDLPVPLAAADFFKGLSHGDMVTFTEGLLAGSTALISYQADWDTNSPTGGLSVALHDFAVIPEPATVAALLGTLALVSVVIVRRRSRRA